MTRRIIIVSAAMVTVVIAAVYFLQPFSLFQKNIEPADNISSFMQYMSETLHWMNFSEIKAAEVQWVIKKDGAAEELVLAGKGFKAERIKDADYRDVKDYFNKLHNNFKIDFTNISSGSITEYVGYKKRDIMVCTVAGQIQNFEEIIIDKDSLWNVVVKCAKSPAP